jgi:hypothetical protein
MHNRIDQWLLFAMVFVEALRGIFDIRHLFHWLQGQVTVWAKGNPSWKHHSVKWSALVAGCAIAFVPSMYYGIHALLAI